jgi:hypothetical protein
VKFPGLIALAFYLGIGALLHAFAVGPQFDWSSAWTWGWLLGWPVAIFIAFWGFMLAMLAIGALLSLLIVISDSETVSRWRMERQMKRAKRANELKRRT